MQEERELPFALTFLFIRRPTRFFTKSLQPINKGCGLPFYNYIPAGQRCDKPPTLFKVLG